MTPKLDNTSAFLHHRPWPLLSHWQGENDFRNCQRITSRKNENQSQLKFSCTLLGAETDLLLMTNSRGWQTCGSCGEHLEDMLAHVKMYCVSIRRCRWSVPEKERNERGWWQRRVWPERGTAPGNKEQIPSAGASNTLGSPVLLLRHQPLIVIVFFSIVWA